MISYPKRKLVTKIATMDTSISDRFKQKQIEAKFAKESVHSVVPVLSKLFFVGTNQCVDVY